jgi:ABC-type sugar transport system ATPase subunit
LLGSLRAQGVGIIFISHAIEEALRVADRITVLRDGKLVSTGPAGGLDRLQVVKMMVGRDISASHYAAHEAGTATVKTPVRSISGGCCQSRTSPWETW